MRTLNEVRALAVRVANTEDVNVQVDNNDYGWHVVVRAGQPTDQTEDGYLLWSPNTAPIMVCASATTLDAATQQVYDQLQFEEGLHDA